MSFFQISRKVTDIRVRLAELAKLYQRFISDQNSSKFGSTDLPPENSRLSSSTLSWISTGLSQGDRSSNLDATYFMPFEPDGQFLTLWLPLSNTGKNLEDRSGFGRISFTGGSMIPLTGGGPDDGTGFSTIAVSLNGVDQWITTNDSPRIQLLGMTTGFTFTIKIYPVSLAASGTRPRTIISKSDDASNGWILTLRDTGDLVFTVRKAGTSYVAHISNSSDYLSINNWYELVCTFTWSTNTPRIYVNSVLVSTTSGATSDTIVDSTRDTRMNTGRRGDDTQNGYYKGFLQDLRFYRELVLTQTQVTNLFTSKQSITDPPIPAGLAAIQGYYNIGVENGLTFPTGTCPAGQHYDFSVGGCVDDSIPPPPPPPPVIPLDRFGIAMIYPSTTDTTRKHNFTSQWDSGVSYTIDNNGNTLGLNTEDPNDTRVVLSSGTLSFHVDGNGVAKCSGLGVGGFRIWTRDQDADSPTSSTLSQSQVWRNVEMTAYCMRVQDGADYNTFRLMARTEHWDISPCDTNGRNYYAGVRNSGNCEIAKEIIHPVYSTEKRTSGSLYSSAFSPDGTFPFNKWVGAKLICRNRDNNTHVQIELWIDETNGAGGGNWVKKHQTIDSGGWTEDPLDSRVDDAIATSAQSGSDCYNFAHVKSHDQIWTSAGYGCGIRFSDVVEKRLKYWSVREIEPLP